MTPAGEVRGVTLTAANPPASSALTAHDLQRARVLASLVAVSDRNLTPHARPVPAC